MNTVRNLCVLLFLAGCATGGVQPARLIAVAEPQTAAEEQPFGVGQVKRSGLATISAPALEAMRNGASVELELFPDARFTVTGLDVARDAGAAVRLNGKVAGAKFFGAAMLGIHGDAAFGTVQVDDRVGARRPRAGAATAVFEVDTAGFRPEGPPLISPTTGPQPVHTPRPAGAATPSLKVLLVLPAQYATVCGSPGVGLTLPRAAAANLNQVWGSFTGNGAYEADVSLYCSTRTAAGGDLIADLDWLRADPAVAAARAMSGANLVSLLVPESEFCGRGYYNDPVAAEDAPWAFSVVVLSCALENYSLAHELGHNLGMLHDRYAEDGGEAVQCNYGFSVLSGGLPVARTAMASSDYCTSLERHCPRIGTYSADRVVGGSTFGAPCDGKGAANNARQFTIAAPVAAGWR